MYKYKIGDYVLITEQRIDNKIYAYFKIKKFIPYTDFIEIVRIQESEIYRAITRMYSDPILKQIDIESIYQFINTIVKDKFPTYDWKYDELESYVVNKKDVEPFGETLFEYNKQVRD